MLTTYLKFSVIFFLLTTFIYAQNPIVNENSIKFENFGTATMVGENGLIMRTTNNGLVWAEQSSNITNSITGFSYNSTVSLACAENGVILRSTDQGLNWDIVLPGTIENFNDIEILNGNSAVCGNNGIIFYSNDNGVTWTEALSNTTNNLNDLKFTSDQNGYAAGDNGTLLNTVDGGQTWRVIDLSFTDKKFNSVEVINESIFIAGDEGTIFISNNGGISWFGPNMLMTEDNFNDIKFFNVNEGVIVGDNGLILKTEDGGHVWNQSSTNIIGVVYDFNSVAFYDENIGITVGTEGIEVYTTDGGSTWNDISPSYNIVFGSKSPILTLKQNYPNPFNPSTKISYELPYAANVTLKVYDIAGREVANLFSGYQNTGNHTVNFDASGLSSGVYFYKLSVQNGLNSTTKVNKMILTK